MRRLLPLLALLSASCEGARPVSRTVDFEVSEGTNLAFDLSPDGRTIVFDMLGQLWLLAVEGGVAVPLTDAVRDTADDAAPTFSPDGRWVAFQSDRPGGPGLFRVPVTGGDPERLTSRPLPLAVSNPAWSPDGRSIAFLKRDSLQLLELDADGSVATTRSAAIVLPGVPRPSPATVTWSPDGARLAVSTASGTMFLPFPHYAVNAVWETTRDGEMIRRLTSEDVGAISPAYSPDGSGVAFFSLEPTGEWQLRVQSGPDGPARRVTDQPGMALRSVRWTPDGRDLLYAADGRLWRVPAAGGTAEPIPFTARVRFERRVATLPPVRFPEPGSEQPIRGFEGISLSPDGRRIAMIALEKLWVWSVGEPARVITDLPTDATSPSWSPDGAEVAFSAVDLFAVDVETGASRRLTSFGGKVEHPVWSPDGQSIAFMHGRTCNLRGDCRGGLVRVIDARASAVTDVAGTASLGVPLDAIAWRPDSKAILTTTPYAPRNNARVFLLSGTTRSLDAYPTAATFLSWIAPDSVLFVRRNVLWRASFDETSGSFGSPTTLTDHAAMYPSVAPSGDVLYVSADGLRRRTAAGDVETLGWPAVFTVPPAPAPLLIRDVRIIDGHGGAPTDARDVLIEDGRIARIAPTPMPDVATGVRLLEAGGRTAIPGLIDTHQHFWFREDGDVALLGGLYYGNTTFRDAGSTLAQTADQRDLVASGALPGPRLVVAGPIFQGHSAAWPGLTDPFNMYVVDSIDIARGVDLVQAFGAGFVKHRDYSHWAALVTLIGEAHRRGLPVSGHCTATLVAVAAGADGQEHEAGCFRDSHRVHEDYARLKAEAGMWVTVTPGFFLPPLLRYDDPGSMSRPDVQAFLFPGQEGVLDPSGARGDLVRSHERWRADTEALYRFGVQLAAGNDGWLPHFTQITLRALVEAGMTPLEAITTATLNSARVIGAEDEIGTIEVGKLADLVILDADPLEDITNTGRIWEVIKSGDVVDREELLRLAPLRKRVGRPPR